MCPRCPNWRNSSFRPGDTLIVNFARDYTGGVEIAGKVVVPQGLSLPVRLVTAGTVNEMVNLGDELYAMRTALAQLHEQVEELRLRSAMTAEARHYTHPGWRGCDRCSSLTFAPNQARGVCPTDKKPHGVSKGSQYTLFVERSRYAGQSGWGWCHKCQGLSYGTTPLSGYCPAGGSHDRARSPNFLLWAAEAPQAGVDAKDFRAQDGWRRCDRCHGLFHGATPGVCPAPGGGVHNAAGSWNYHLQW